MTNSTFQLGFLCQEVTTQGHAVLVFCATKKNCELCSNHLSDLFDEVAPQELLAQRRRLIEELKRTPGGLDPTLEKSIQKGVAFHHAGLTVEEREVIEQGFRAGVVNVLCCTSTLAAGVNLPARRVIFHSPFIGTEFLDSTRYRQMCGRAGRTGKDTCGMCLDRN